MKPNAVVGLKWNSITIYKYVNVSGQVEHSLLCYK